MPCAILHASLLFVALATSEARSQAVSGRDGLEAGEYSVGFQLIEEQDHSRTVTGGVSPSRPHPRPIRTYLWYPARNSNDARPMRFGDYAALADDDIWPSEIVGPMRGKLKFARWLLARRLGPAGFDALLRQPVLAIENAEALEGPFPLIVIGQGLYFEFPVSFAALAEYLAGRGFVVATCPLVGTNSPFVRIDALDLETQVRDLEFVIARVRRMSFVSPERLGVFGFDMGGMAGLILTMRNSDVDAFVSVSSGIIYQHPSGLPGASSSYDPLALRAPWLHSMAASWMEQPPDSQSKSLFETAVHAERFLLLTEGMDHFDYTSLALIEGPWNASDRDGIEGYKAVSRYIYNFFAAFLAQDPRSRGFIAQSPQESDPGSSMTLEHRPAAPASISYEEFVQAVVAGQADQAIDELRKLRETNPDHILLDDEYLRRLVSTVRTSWGLTEEAMPVIKLRAELYPTSVDAQQMLAEGYIDAGDFRAAIETYSALLEKNPDDSRIKSRLEWLRNQ
ncbi:MAG TPA: tetratricopeptide repeat protein [Vicinamibacteria bacterium]|nr:tetratricopeptide repeat protein [Vicinamibacteria bacterium]